MSEIYEEEIKYLEICIKEIEETLKWGRKEEWTNYHFTQLSEKITELTGVSLSVSSIRRIFGQDKSYKEKFNPQIETKNTLARFIGYESWVNFKQSKKKSPVAGIVKSVKINSKTLIIFLLLVFLIISGYYMYTFLDKKWHPELFYFDGRHLYGDPPHTVAFHYDITQMRSNDFYINFGEHYHPPHDIRLPKNEHILTHTYYNSYGDFYKLIH
jgi:hypothetical protein